MTRGVCRHASRSVPEDKRNGATRSLASRLKPRVLTRASALTACGEDRAQDRATQVDFPRFCTSAVAGPDRFPGVQPAHYRTLNKNGERGIFPSAGG